MECKVKIECQDVMDFLDSLESESVDLIVADPPYNSSMEWDRKDNQFQLEWLERAKKVLKQGGSFYMFFAPMNMFEVEKWIRSNLTLKNLIVWYHPNLYGSGLSYGKDRYKSTWDIVFYAVKGQKAKHGKNISAVAYIETGRGFDVMIYAQPRPLLHKAQKPLGLIEKFIICSSNEGDLVCDPFVGVGTTAIACVRTKRRFIGCDNNEMFVELARQRVDNIGDLKKFDKMIWKNLKNGKLQSV